jgi:hypothetical protein
VALFGVGSIHIHYLTGSHCACVRAGDGQESDSATALGQSAGACAGIRFAVQPAGIRFDQLASLIRRVGDAEQDWFIRVSFFLRYYLRFSLFVD